jgi:transposase
MPIGRKPARLFFRIPRVECGECHVNRQVHVPFAEPRRQYTRA